MLPLSKPIDMSKVKTVVYHFPDGRSFSLRMDGLLEHFFDLGMGEVCDTSDIDGVIHFFPRGHA